ncbi:uncharacterized protein EI90DRAFT_3018963 [Cantharellus anzutake]|uniref:uncharacterized protein n=1 Tax=Cantharellus anzutake TaxID=1750568 RepID=UPI001904969F|nr:uncharacterized protein EI90DRAFT_3018963 [Cantharellus anzutake]KAF8325620.1 hypothetical protein EI90DRAFT_3018963 [Cantharellus anzutake]
MEAHVRRAEPPGRGIEDDETGIELLNIDVSPNRSLVARSQFEDYSHRGYELEDMSLLEFTTDSYERNTCQDKVVNQPTDNTSTTTTRRGRPANSRSQYLVSHQSHKTKLRVVRSSGHRTIANIIGKWFPRGDNSDFVDSHHASMLCLLKPWRNLSTLKGEGETWTSAYENFLNSERMDDRTAAIVGNAQFYYDCKDAATRQNSDSTVPRGQAHTEGTDDEMEDMEDGGLDDDNVDWSEASLERFLKDRNKTWEVLHGEHAVECARLAQIFSGMGTWQADTVSS